MLISLSTVLPVQAQADDSSEIAVANIEIIQVQNQRNQLSSNALVENNAQFLSLLDSETVKPTIANWLAQVPGLALTGQGGLLQSYSIRGFSKWRIQTQVDGIPIYTDRRAGNSVSFLSANLLSGIDVTQGPSSTLYGSDAIGGVINLQTLDFGTKLVAASLQSNGEQQELLLATGTDSWQSALNYRHGNKGESANSTENKSTVLANDYQQFTLVQKYQTKWQGWQIKASWLPSYGKDIGKSSAQYPDERITNYPTDIHSLAQIELTQADNWYAKFYHHYQNWDSDIERVGKRRNLTEYQSHTLGGSLLTHSPAVDAITGGYSRFGIDINNRQGVSIAETEYRLTGEQNYHKALVDAQQHNAAIFSDIHWQVNNLGIAAGLRYDYISQRQFINADNKSDSKLNASLLFNWQANSKVNWQFELASGFRFPTLTELYFEGETPRGTTLGNPVLNPETSKGAQLSINWQLDENVNLTAASYYYQLDDYIERYNVNDELRSYRNLPQATLKGIELSTNWQQSAQISHSLVGHWQKGEDQAGDIISDIAAPKLMLTSNITFTGWQFENQISYRFKQTSVSSQEQALAAFTNWQISAKRQINQQLSVSVWAENLLDKLAYTTADEDAPYELGRNIGIKFNYEFN